MARRVPVPHPPGNPDMAIGYVRVSTDDQRLSPDAQERAIREWCAHQGVVLLEVHYDIGVSGGLPVDERPGLTRVATAVERTGAGHLVVAKRDRLARNVLEAHLFERLLAKFNCRVRSVAGEGTDVDDPNDPMAFMLKTMIDMLAQWERLVIKQRTKAAMAELRRQGKAVGSRPYGFKTTGQAKHGGDTRLMPDEQEQRAIANVVAWRERGYSLNEIGTLLAQNGFMPRNASRRWDATQIRRMLLRAQAEADATHAPGRAEALRANP